MKRFYCTICQRVKRVRVYPPSVKVYHDDGQHIIDAYARRGVCKWHGTARHYSNSNNSNYAASKGGK